MIILGIGGIQDDAASAVLKDGQLVAAVEESKLVRRRWNCTSSTNRTLAETPIRPRLRA